MSKNHRIDDNEYIDIDVALIQSAYSHHLHHPQVIPTYGYWAMTLNRV